MYQRENAVTRTRDSILSTHTVLRNTYLLLSMTLIFSGAIAYFAMVTNAQPMHFLVYIVGFFGLLYITERLADSAWGLLSVFAFTGFMGYVLGPILNMYLHQFTNGAQLITTALTATGVIFVGLSGYVLISKKDFSYMGGFLAVFGLTLMIGILLSFFFPAMMVFMSMGIALFSAAMIMFQTSMIINGGETNYIRATVNLYVSIFNLLLSLLRIISAFGGRS